ncbi:MAG: clostripain-related cysteine peptidase, partial [Prevotellaceae bacterium]|nr:clostripain-related cysteine peptidase [Prevotellaceae bacterium]
ILNDFIEVAPAHNYSMLIGSHGMGWVPIGTNVYTRSASIKNIKDKHENSDKPITRYFGSSNDKDYMIDIQTLAEGISAVGIKMKYIVYDACYMSNIETVYDLKDVTEYFIASTSEIMGEGMPYNKIGINLLYNDYENIVNNFYSYYSTYSTPCGTIGVTDCSEVENTVTLMKEINSLYPSGLSSTADIQVLDGFNSPVFYDFGNYIDSLCTDETLRAQFDEQLEKLVPYKAATETYYYNNYDGNGQKQINAFSGITVSDPTTNSSVVSAKTQTNWYKATH